MINISICFSFDTGDKKNPYVYKQIMIIECNKISLSGCLSLPKTVVFLFKWKSKNICKSLQTSNYVNICNEMDQSLLV